LNGYHQGCDDGAGTSSAFSYQTQQLDGTLYSGATGDTFTNVPETLPAQLVFPFRSRQR
jgi:hypothetical protein